MRAVVASCLILDQDFRTVSVGWRHTCNRHCTFRREISSPCGKTRRGWRKRGDGRTPHAWRRPQATMLTRVAQHPGCCLPQAGPGPSLYDSHVRLCCSSCRVVSLRRYVITKYCNAYTHVV